MKRDLENIWATCDVWPLFEPSFKNNCKKKESKTLGEIGTQNGHLVILRYYF